MNDDGQKQEIKALLREITAQTEEMPQKEQFLDDIATRISGMKMHGKPVDDNKLLGTDLQQGAELFGLQEFTPKMQTDILLNLAYFRSDAFKDRVVASLGYDRLEDMSDRESEQDYDYITKRAEKAYENIDFEVEENPVCARMEGNDDGRYTLHIPDGKTQVSKELGQMHNSANVVAHEMAHYVYNAIEIYPGAVNYGKTDSPINSITENEINHEKFVDINKHVWKSDEFQKEYDEIYNNLPKETAAAVSNIVTKAKESSKKELLKDKEFLDEMEDHDNEGYERAADIHAASMLMLREGIWNPFGKEPLTIQQIKEFEHRHPNSRIFEYWNHEEATRFLNTVAQNEQGNSPADDQKKDLQQIIRDFDSQKFMSQLNQFATVMYGSDNTEAAQTEQKRPAHADRQQASQRQPLSAEDLMVMTTMNYETEAQSQNESQQTHRSAGCHI